MWKFLVPEALVYDKVLKNREEINVAIVTNLKICDFACFYSFDFSLMLNRVDLIFPLFC